ncbi:MAG: hypothetical protein AAF152_14085 [Cyanobacteria bacterium P01_A01_bin.114]
MRTPLASVNLHRCSLCSDNLLRHIRRNQLYWFCPSCRQEMPEEQQPEISAVNAATSQAAIAVKSHSIYDAQAEKPANRHQDLAPKIQKLENCQLVELHATSRG